MKRRWVSDSEARRVLVYGSVWREDDNDDKGI